MSQHPSLRLSDKTKAHRSVLKRYERVADLESRDKWKDGDSVMGLPKVKSIKLKVRKKGMEKSAEEGTEAKAEAATVKKEEPKKQVKDKK